MPIFCNNQIVVSKDKKHKWKWHKTYGWEEDNSSNNTVSPVTKDNRPAEEKKIKPRGYMSDLLTK